MQRDLAFRRIAIAVAVILACVLSGFAGGWLESRGNDPGSLTEQRKIVTSQSQLISEIAKEVGPSVVSVNVSIGGGDFDQPQLTGAGTGIIVSDNVIVTNRHVVPADATSVSVTLSDGTELEAVSVIGRTSDSDNLDVAFLKVDDTKGRKLRPAVLGDSSKVEVGDNVVAIGNALGQFQNTVTSGIISGYGRDVQARDRSSAAPTENLNNLFQTDAAINEGNSGGPLVNLNAQVIGINTAVAGDAENIGFAIPINDVKGLVNQVVKTGKLARPYLGVVYTPVTADLADQYDLDVDDGAFIIPSSDPAKPSILPNSPAARAGLKEKDVIVAVNGRKVDQTRSLVSLLGQHQPGDEVDLTIKRGNRTMHVDVRLGTAPTN